MTEKSWQTLKVQYCHHADEEVGLEAELVYPPEILPDQPPRILAHRCSHGLACNLDGRPSCIWAGTNPAYDPFTAREKKSSPNNPVVDTIKKNDPTPLYGIVFFIHICITSLAGDL